MAGLSLAWRYSDGFLVVRSAALNCRNFHERWIVLTGERVEGNTLMESAHLSRHMSAWEARVAGWGGHIFRDRPTPGPDDVVLISNDYLALARHPELIATQVNALTSSGNGMMMSGVFVPKGDPQHEFEADMATFLQAPAVVLCQSGWDANVGLVNTLLAAAPTGSPVYLDMLAHASLWAGASSGGGAIRPFVHNNVDHLERLIAEYGPGLVCVDTLYSVTGDQAPLADLVEVCERSGCQLVADESHALGVYGPSGNGLAVEYGLTERIAYRTASLAKAFSGRAGIITGSRRFSNYLPYQSPNAIFSSTVLPHDTAGLHAALRVISTDDVRRKQLWNITERLHTGLWEHGCDTYPSDSPILPLHAGSDANLRTMQQILDGHGVFGAAFIPPATPKNRAVLRLTAHAALSDAAVDHIIKACAAVAPLITLRPKRRG